MRVQFLPSPPVSLVEAKKILGDEAFDMSDDEIQQLIDDLDILAQYTIKMVQEFRNSTNITD